MNCIKLQKQPIFGGLNWSNARTLRWLSKMDASEYARIVDLLRQISLKVDKNCIPTTDSGSVALMEINNRLDSLVRILDHAAWLDNKGHF
jgi:hypothetical protein